MPQLETWHFLPQIFWLAVCFITLYLVMAFVALPKIGSVLAQRKEKVESDLDAAEKAKMAADSDLEAYEASLVGARETAHQTIGEAAQANAKTTEACNQELDAEVGALIEEASKAINAAKSQAMENLASMAAEAAREATAKLIGVDVAEADAADAVAAVKEA